jgi:hypothetical protein
VRGSRSIRAFGLFGLCGVFFAKGVENEDENDLSANTTTKESFQSFSSIDHATVGLTEPRGRNARGRQRNN